MSQIFDNNSDIFKNIKVNQRWATYCLYFISLVLFGYLLVRFRSLFFPVVLGVLIASFLVGGSNWLETKGWGRSASSAVMTLASFFTFLLVMGAVTFGVQRFLEKASTDDQQSSIEKHRKELVSTIVDKTGLSTERINAGLESLITSVKNSAKDLAKKSAATSLNVLTGFLLLHIYIFLFLHLRDHFYEFGKQIVDLFKGERSNYKDGVRKSVHVTSQYLKGKSILMFVLFGMFYGAYLLIGIKNALLFAMLAAVLSWIPFVGTFIAYLLPVVYSVFMGNPMDAVWVSVAYAVIQSLESYVLTPMIIGKEIELNPFFTIFGVIAGGTLWGVPGMVVALPVIGIMRVTFTEDRKTEPYGELMADPDDSELDSETDKN
jgi:predicted PurR-regulated permease PerM